MTKHHGTVVFVPALCSPFPIEVSPLQAHRPLGRHRRSNCEAPSGTLFTQQWFHGHRANTCVIMCVCILPQDKYENTLFSGYQCHCHWRKIHPGPLKSRIPAVAVSEASEDAGI